MVGHRRQGIGKLLLVCAAVLAVLAAAGSASAAPGNDDFANAQTLSSTSGSIAGSNVGATLEPTEPSHHLNPGGHSIWYKWTTPDGGPFVLSATGISGNVILAVYTGSSLSSLSLEASNDQGNPSKVCVKPPSTGTTFWIALDGYADQTGATNLSWDRYPDGSVCPTSAAEVTGQRQFPTVGAVLTGVDATWLPATGVTETHQWFRCLLLSCAPIPGATGSTYTVGIEDTGTRLRYTDTATAGGSSFTSSSGPTGVAAMMTENANGGTIAYASDRDGAQSHIYTSASNGSGSATQRTFTASGGGDIQPNWSTHGDSSIPDRIAFSSNGILSWVTAAATSAAGTSSIGGVAGIWPSVRRNATRISYATGSSIKLVDPNGDNVATVASAPGDLHPSYSSDGTRVVFEEGSDLWIGQAASSGQDFVQLTFGGTDHEPAWSPDGSDIAFIRSGQLWVMNADGTNVRQLDTGTLTAVADPAWSPDAQQILFAGTTGGNSDIYRIHWDGAGGPVDLTPGTASNETQPTWQPLATGPALGTPPSISGTTEVGQTLTGNDGSYEGTLPLNVSRQWQRCTSSCSDVSGATGTQYTLGTADLGAQMRLMVVVQNSVDSQVFTSALSAVVTAAGSGGGGGGGGGGSTGGGGGSTGGGGGGGGGSSVVPDLGVTVKADAATANVGDNVVFRIAVTDKTAAIASNLHLKVTLPANASVAQTYADRGPGCSVTNATTVDCNLDYISGDSPVANVILTLKLTAAGAMPVTATATYQLVDPTPADNTASFTVNQTPAAPPVVPAPVPTKVFCLVPKVSGLTLVKALVRLRLAHCRTATVKLHLKSVKLGKIGVQLPKAGTKLAANAKVKITVSLGPAKKHKLAKHHKPVKHKPKA